MKILILSKEAWRADENGGNVLSNIFSGFGAEFAQVFCMDALPDNNLCKKYYQMTDKMMADRIFKLKSTGRVIEYEDYPQYHEHENEAFSSVRKIHWIGIQIARELLWKFAHWNNKSLREFVKDYNPDIIFAPCYGTHYMIRLTQIVKQICDVPVVSYISDDFYTNSQRRLSPLYWINHFLLRAHVRRVFKQYSLTYTMTDEQKEQCERDFGANMRILRKAGQFEPSREKKDVNSPIRLIYAGSMYVNRWKTLCALANALRKINIESSRMVLDIYSSYEIPTEIRSILDDGVCSRIHKPVSMEDLRRLYSESDIALHVESFDKNYANAVRMSFSTKIVDCLDSGCAVLAICDKTQAGLSYLNNNDAAICITNEIDIEPTLNSIICNPKCLIDYQKKAFTLGRKNHDATIIKNQLLLDFEKLINNDATC